MRENRKSILLAVISGIVACIVCVGVVFTFPTNKSNLKGNESTLPNNLEEEEEIKLGDTGDVCGTWNYSSWSLDTNGYGAWTCGTPSGGTGEPPASATGTVWNGVETGDHDNCTSPCNSPCYRTTTYKRIQTTCASYSSCGDHKHLDSNNMCQCDDGFNLVAGVCKCNNGTYLNGDTCVTCPKGSMCVNGTKTGCSGTNQYQDEEGQTSCKTCINHGVATDHAVACTSCEQGYTYDANSNQCMPNSGCSDGQWRGQYGCEACPKGFKCPGTGSKIACDGANEYQDETGQSTCKTCTAHSIKTNNETKCTTCEQGYVYISNQCIPLSGCSDGYFRGQYGCEACPKGFRCSGDGSKVACDGANEYQDETGKSTCKTCQAHSTKTGGNDVACTCEANFTYNSYTNECIPLSGCSAGYFRGQYGCEACTAGYYCPNGMGREACPNGQTSEAKATSVDDCYTKTKDMTCSISVTKASETVSIDATDPTKNSFYSVKVTVNGQGCSGLNLSYSAVNGRLSKGGESNVTSGFNYYFMVYPQNACAASSATATLSDNKGSGTVSFERLAVKYDWKVKNGCWAASEVEGKYPVGSQAADAQGKDVYYANYSECNGGWGYTEMWTRANCGKSTGGPQTYNFCCVKNDGSGQSWLTGQTSKTCPEGYTLDSTKNSNTCLKTFACYKDSDNNTYWTSDPQPSWVVVPKSEQECKDQEACFEDATGQRFWGKHYDQIANGYILITSIKDEDTCINPSDDDACYINDEDLTDYRWSKTPLTGYTKADSIKNAKECQPDACYIEKDKNEFAFGKYKDNENYIPVYKTIEVDGEYKDVLITDKKECTNEVPVEPTDFDVTKIVYVFMAILMACGIAFIYYSSVAKKQNQ